MLAGVSSTPVMEVDRVPPARWANDWPLSSASRRSVVGSTSRSMTSVEVKRLIETCATDLLGLRDRALLLVASPAPSAAQNSPGSISGTRGSRRVAW